MKKTFLHLSVCCAILLSVVTAHAQDIHFSQFYQSPLNLNPAMTGVMNCNHRLVANYRNQWASILKKNAYNTISVRIETPVLSSRPAS